MQIICGKRIACVCVCARASMCTHVHVHACTQSCPILTPWTVAYQALLSVEFFRQDYWSELPFSSPEDLPNPGIEPMSPALQADSLLLSHQGSPRERILLGRNRNRGKSQSFPVPPGVMPCPMESFCSGCSVPSCKPVTYIPPCPSAFYFSLPLEDEDHELLHLSLSSYLMLSLAHVVVLHRYLGQMNE